MRDARIAAIYEGTNGIQAMDLVGRKLQGDGGAALREFLKNVQETATIMKAGKRGELKSIGARLAEAADATAQSADWLLAAAKGDQNDVLAGATPFLRQFGNVVGGFYLAKGAIAASLALGEAGADAAWLEGKIAIADFFAENYLTEATGLTPAVTSGAKIVERLDPAQLNA
ncbi:MAG: acyl-CoA dehydrogenase [Parvularculaceae bacterium]